MVSISVTTKNEQNNIANCLKSLKNQTYRNIEIIVVDNNSVDNTVKIAQKFTEKVYNYGPERSSQRNYGALKIAKGEYLLYLDADMVLTRDVIEKCVNYLKIERKVVGLYLPELIIGSKYFSKVRRFERYFYNGTVIDGVRFMRLNSFKEVKGFDERIVGFEDWDLDISLGKSGELRLLDNNNDVYAIWTNKSLEIVAETLLDNALPSYFFGIMHNERDLTFLNYLNKKRYYLNYAEIYTQKWGKNHSHLQKQFDLYYRFIGMFVCNNNWKITRRRLDLYFSFIIYKVIMIVYNFRFIQKFNVKFF